MWIKGTVYKMRSRSHAGSDTVEGNIRRREGRQDGNAALCQINLVNCLDFMHFGPAVLALRPCICNCLCIVNCLQLSTASAVVRHRQLRPVCHRSSSTSPTGHVCHVHQAAARASRRPTMPATRAPSVSQATSTPPTRGRL